MKAIHAKFKAARHLLGSKIGKPSPLRAGTLEEDDARNRRDGRWLQTLLDLLRIHAGSADLIIANEEPFTAFLAPDINRERAGGFRQLKAPARKLALLPDPSFARIRFGAR